MNQENSAAIAGIHPAPCPQTAGVGGDEAYALLAAGGAMARVIDGFEARAQQQAMACAVARAMAARSTLLVEAGTGTGKTLAYLLPALTAGARVVISTGTRNLQDQLHDKDLPLVRAALGQPVQVVLLKGRANYLCLHRLQQAEAQGSLDRVLTDHLQRVREWAGRTRSGDLAGLDGVPEDAPVQRYITSTSDNCLGQDCPEWSRCHLVKARRAALDADVVIVNHHLFFADLALREEGFGELLPRADCVIFDEAHQLPEVATRFFGSTLSTAQLRELADDAERAALTVGADASAIAVLCARLREQLGLLRARLEEGTARLSWEEVRERPAVTEALQGLVGVLDGLARGLDREDGDAEAQSCTRRALALRGRAATLADACPANTVRWVELYARGCVWHSAPLEVAETFAAHMRAHPAAWVFTSATLAVDDSFQHFAERMGIVADEARVLPSPFDYARQALSYLPDGLPEPGHPGHTGALVEAILPVLAASAGRAFLLFTSRRAMLEAAALLRGAVPYPLLVQGEAPRAALVERFVALGNAVLLGTASFWEGIDVRGDALSCVVIDKLPFAAPDDPVLDARLRDLRARGGDPFRDLQLPQAVIALKQGAGRLIRSSQDRGVLVLGDPRLASRGYGQVFVRALPPMTRTRSLARVQSFLAGDDLPGSVHAAPTGAEDA